MSSCSFSHRTAPINSNRWIYYFSSVNTHYNSKVVAWLRAHPGRRVTEYEIAVLFASAYGRAASVINATHRFEKAGIYLFRDDLFSEADFAGNYN